MGIVNTNGHCNSCHDLPEGRKMYSWSPPATTSCVDRSYHLLSGCKLRQVTIRQWNLYCPPRPRNPSGCNPLDGLHRDLSSRRHASPDGPGYLWMFGLLLLLLMCLVAHLSMCGSISWIVFGDFIRIWNYFQGSYCRKRNRIDLL